MLQMNARSLRRLGLLTAILLANMSPASAQDAHPPFLRRDVPPTTGWHYDDRGDTRDFQNNGFFPGDFAANPGSAWLGAAGIFGSTPSGGSHFGVIYCDRRYRSHAPLPSHFQGDDGVWYRCHR